MPHEMFTTQHYSPFFFLLFSTVFAYIYNTLLLFLLHLLWLLCLLCLFCLLLVLTQLNYQLALDFVFTFIWFMTTQSIYDLSEVFHAGLVVVFDFVVFFLFFCAQLLFRSCDQHIVRMMQRWRDCCEGNRSPDPLRAHKHAHEPARCCCK